VALTIAGTDSGGGAGVAADLRTFSALGVFGTLVVTAVTAQNTLGVRDFLAIAPEMVAAQLDAVLSDMPVRAAKTGMLATPGTVRLLASRGAAGQLPPLVVDPVLVTSSGRPMFSGDDVAGAYRDLFACATVVTPNLPEAALLTGRALADLEAIEAAARELQALGPQLVIVKAGAAAASRPRRRVRRALRHTPAGAVDRHGERPWQRVHALCSDRRRTSPSGSSRSRPRSRPSSSSPARSAGARSGDSVPATGLWISSEQLGNRPDRLSGVLSAEPLRAVQSPPGGLESAQSCSGAP